jgi:copper chaperone
VGGFHYPLAVEISEAQLMNTITLTAPDISCDHCKMTIEKEIGALAGVQVCAVDVPTRAVTVTYDPARVSRERIAEALDEEGYPVVS